MDNHLVSRSASPVSGNPILTVSELNRQIALLLRSQVGPLWVRGEISNFTEAASGHWYFSIKDDAAMVRAVMFRSRARATGLRPRAGDRFEFLATPSLYEPRGDYQLQVETMRPAGRGDLHEAFLALKEKLAREGLFASERKQPIAPVPRAIGVVTSLAAAALRDVLATLRRRAPHVAVVVYPAPVQGADAARHLEAALRIAVLRNEVDTLLLVRGGGSIEDLWSFNDEGLARAVASSPIPVICGIGHETDFTICDFAADLRAPTPTAAAELVCLARDECLERVRLAWARIDRARQMRYERASLRLDRAVSALISPRERLRQQGASLEQLRQRLLRADQAQRQRQAAKLALVHARLMHATPVLQQRQDRLTAMVARLTLGMRNQTARSAQRLYSVDETLQALNPRHILQRGYAIVRDARQEVVKNALDLRIGETLSVELDRGVAHVDVVRVQQQRS